MVDISGRDRGRLRVSTCAVQEAESSSFAMASAGRAPPRTSDTVTILTLPPTDWARIAISGPTEDQRPATTLLVFRLWLLAFGLKMLGSTWDMSWHLKWLRDDLAPPHLLNTAGTTLAVALVVFQVRTGVGLDRRAKGLMIAGTAIFLAAIPIDVLNHKINGLDITAWSASHALLYIGTALMILG